MDRKRQLIRAVELAMAGDWDVAHAIAQEHEGEAAADWLHAVLHKIEGDASNARYWYRHSGRHEYTDFLDPAEELAALLAELRADQS